MIKTHLLVVGTDYFCEYLIEYDNFEEQTCIDCWFNPIFQKFANFWSLQNVVALVLRSFIILKQLQKWRKKIFPQLYSKTIYSKII